MNNADMPKSKTVTLISKFDAKQVTVRVDYMARAPYVISARQDKDLRRKAGLIGGDYFANAVVGY